MLPRHSTVAAIIFGLLGSLSWGVRLAKAGTFTWSGVQWSAKSGTEMGPGPNAWSGDNVFVDGNGDLHLSITNVNGAWTCAEVSTTATYGFGTYQWQVTTPVDSLDPNVVLGLFVYGPLALGPDGTHEIDIEYTRFGSADAESGHWTNWPNLITAPSLIARSSFPLALGATPATTSRFIWGANEIAYSALSGLQSPGSDANTIRSWTYQPTRSRATISQSPMPVHMNLWLYQGNPPVDGRNVEVVIHSFTFAASSTAVPAVPQNRILHLMAAFAMIGLLALRVARPRRA